MSILLALLVSNKSFAKEDRLLTPKMAAGASLDLAEENQSTKPQSLIDIYQLALAKDPVLASALNANKAAHETIEQSKALYRPIVSFKAGASASETDIKRIVANFFGEQGRHSFESYRYGVNARQPIYRKDSWLKIDQTKTQVSQSDKRYHLSQQVLISRVTQAYFEVLLAQDKIDLIAAQKAAIAGQRQQAKANFEVGTATITDVNEAQARYDLIRSQEIAAMNEYQVARRTVQLITGEIPAKLVTVKPDIHVAELGQTMAEWQQVAAQNNLSIQIQQDVVKNAEHEVEIANAGHLPTLDAVASYGVDYANGGSNGFGNKLDNGTIGFELEIPLYSGGGVSSRVRQAVFNKQSAQDDLNLKRREIDLDTQRAYLNLNSSIVQIAALEQALSSSQSQLDSTNLGYEVGVRTSIDVLNAQQQLYSAKTDLLQSRYSYLVNIVSLKSAVGLVSETDLQDINQQLITTGAH